MKKISFIFVILMTIFMCSCINDSSEKLRLYEEASNRWQVFMNSDQLSIEVEMKVSAKKKDDVYFLVNESTRAEAKMCKSPFYLEAKQDREVLIIQEENGELYQYATSSSDSKYLERTYFGDMSSIDTIEDSYYDEDPLMGLNIDDMKINYDENVYTFKINLYDYIQNVDNAEEMKDIISSLGGDEKSFKNFWVTISMSFFETTADMIIKLDYLYEGINISIIMDTKFNNKKFSIVDVNNNPNYFIKHPNTMDGVYKSSSIGETIQIPSFTINYFKFNLEKGQYGFYATDVADQWIDDWALGCMDIKLYNENREEISIGMGINAYSDSFPGKTFYISEPGTYYLRVWSDISEGMDICIKQLDYETIGFESKQEFASGKGTIEGEYDFDVFTIDGKEGEVLVFKNTGKNPIPIYYCKYENSYSYLEIVNDETLIELKKGENKFIICSDFHHYVKPIEYEFTVQKYVLENGYEKNYEDLKKVTTDFSNLTYIAGNSLPNPRLSFDVETKSIIDFQFQTDGILQSNAYAVVKDLKGNRYYSIEGNIYELDPGKYIVEIDASKSFTVCQIKYTATEIEDKEIDVTLEKGLLSNISNFPTIKAQNVGRTQKVKYNFTLSEDSLIAFEPAIQIFHKDGTPIIYFGNNYYKIVDLSKGEYYYLIESIGNYYFPSSDYKIGIAYDKLETTPNPSQMKEIKVGQELVLRKDWDYDVDYLILHIEEDGWYQFNKVLDIYDTDFRYLTFTYLFDANMLNAGTYYLIYSHYGYYAEESNEVSILITKTK